MKATVCSEATSAAVNAVFGLKSTEGRVSKKPAKELENEEIQMYLSKLKELVPFMPKNKKVSKLEVIQHVIDYICDLQYTLEKQPVNRCHQSQSSTASSSRQPLGVISSPDSLTNTSSLSEVSMLEKVVPCSTSTLEEIDTRPVSV